MGLAESHSKTCCLSNNYRRCAYKLTPVTMSVCSWDLKWNLLLHTKLFKQIHGQEKSRQRGTEDVTLHVCVQFAFRKAKEKKKTESYA